MCFHRQLGVKMDCKSADVGLRCSIAVTELYGVHARRLSEVVVDYTQPDKLSSIGVSLETVH